MLLPLIIGLALGIFTGGHAYFRKITIVDSVREGARYGASLPVPPGAGGTAEWELSVRSRVAEVSGGELSIGDVCVKLVYAIGGNHCGVPDPSGASAEPAVHLVKVSATKTAQIDWVFLTMDTTLRGELAARYERDSG